MEDNKDSEPNEYGEHMTDKIKQLRELLDSHKPKSVPDRLHPFRYNTVEIVWPVHDFMEVINALPALLDVAEAAKRLYEVSGIYAFDTTSEGEDVRTALREALAKLEGIK